MTKLVGIVNLTPDSFSDGGSLPDTASALAHTRALIAEGADVLDIGAESTRPGATPLTPSQEWERLGPVLPEILAIARDTGCTVSLDTRHAPTAARALALGIHWINDVGGLKDAEMRRIVADHSCRLVLMHSLGVPANPNVTLPEEADVIDALLKDARQRIKALESEGIVSHRLIYDPGIGFGKTMRQNLQILSYASSFTALGMPLLFGHSRKRFMQHFSQNEASARDDLTAAFSAMLMLQGIDYLRVHAVGKHATLRHAILRKE
jgi:dihydropteroate synthase